MFALCHHVGMAGGMGSRERGMTLAQRSGVAAADRKPAGACHCWVIGAAGQPYPGLLIEWRLQSGGWQGLVTYLVVEESGTLALVQTWLDANRLRAARR